MRVVLVSCYELGRQPFGLASPAAWLVRAGAEVSCLDLAVEPLREDLIAGADLIAIHLPMHTATRMASGLIPKIRALNPAAHLCCYGLYAPLNVALLRGLGVQSILGGEFEQGLATLVGRLSHPELDPADSFPEAVSLERQQFLVPERATLPDLSLYAKIRLPGGELRVVGYTEATRGCKHLCRHCPIVPVYNGAFRVVQREVVLADIANQVAAGARHITFGDPDFFNGPGHAIAVVEELHRRFPLLTYDVTIKVQHLVQHENLLPALRDTGCLFVTSAVEALDPVILDKFDKHHTREDFIRVARTFRNLGLHLNPTFVTFTPWTSLESYADLLTVLLDLDLVSNVAPIQYAIRLLITANSRLLELPETREVIGEFDQKALAYPWRHPDPQVDLLHQTVLELVGRADDPTHGLSRCEVFQEVWRLTEEALGDSEAHLLRSLRNRPLPPPQAVPYLTEPWYC